MWFWPIYEAMDFSSKPPRGENDAAYTKREMANDLVQVMDSLEYKKFFVLSHDRGSRVSHRMALDHPERILKIVFLDIAPTLHMYENGNTAFATAYWHWFLYIQSYPIPERIMAANPGEFVGAFIAKSLPDIDPVALASYKAAFELPGAMDAMIAEYRASAPGGLDLTLDAKDRESSNRLKMPIMILWGGNGIIGRLFDPIKAWQDVCESPSLVKQGMSIDGVGQ